MSKYNIATKVGFFNANFLSLTEGSFHCLAKKILALFKSRF